MIKEKTRPAINYHNQDDYPTIGKLKKEYHKRTEEIKELEEANELDVERDLGFRLRRGRDMKSVGFSDLFLLYPYKTISAQEVNTIPVTRVTKDTLVNDHAYSLDYKTWKTIVCAIFDYIVHYLKSGKRFVLPGAMGSFRVKKWRPNRIKIGESASYNPLFKNMKMGKLNSDVNKPILKWDRKYYCSLPQRYLWVIKMPLGNWKKIKNYLQEDIARTDRLIEA